MPIEGVTRRLVDTVTNSVSIITHQPVVNASRWLRLHGGVNDPCNISGDWEAQMPTFRLSITVKHNCETALVLGFVLCVVNTAHEEAHDRVETGKGVIITQRRGESVH